MTKRRQRPWDRQPQARNNKNSANKTTPSFVTVQGQTYYSDRFYLVGETNNDRPRNINRHSTSINSQRRTTTRGIVPPLLDLKELVESLDLRGAVLASYGSMSTASFPSLLGPQAVVPTLVLRNNKSHGVEEDHDDDDENESPNEQFARSERQQQLSETTLEKHDSDEHDDDDCDETLLTQDFCEEEEASTHSTIPSPSRAAESSDVLPATVHVSRVTATWLNPAVPMTSADQEQVAGFLRHLDDAATTGTTTSDDSSSPNFLPDAVLRHRSRGGTGGCFHSKFLLLYETAGSLVMVVTTANVLNGGYSCVDGAWVQRFFPHQVTTEEEEEGLLMPQQSQFSQTWRRFLRATTVAIRAGDWHVHGFLRHYGLPMIHQFEFGNVQVDLVATVPGVFRGTSDNDGSQEEEELAPHTNSATWGRQHVAQVLELALPRWGIAGEDDRVLIQPTSFGAEWTVEQMQHVAKSYGRSFDQIDIMWPTRDFVALSRRKEVHGMCPVSCADLVSFENIDSFEVDGSQRDRDGIVSGELFLSSDAFNRSSLEVLSRMVTYESAKPRQHPTLIMPHFKSVTRVYTGDRNQMRRDHGRAQQYFSWFLLTSACLSRGAQGVPTNTPNTVCYGNFELGVLFTTHVSSNKYATTTNRIYCCQPDPSSCNSKTSRLIHLPVPYSLSFFRYQQDPDEADFSETPYFHEVSKDGVAVGNMRLTPLGRTAAKVLND